MMEKTSVSVIVPCRNEVRHIDAFLDSLARQRFAGRLEVVIADGMSDDGTREILDRRRASLPGLRVIDNPERTVSFGLNAAIRHSSGEIIVRMDVHSEYAEDYIQRSVEVLEQSGADNVGGPALTRAEGFLAQAIAVAYRTPFACGGARFHDPGYEGFVDTVTYGCWRKATLERLGLFDEQLCRNQDDELNLRLVRAGGRIWQSPRIVSWYRPRGALRPLFRQYLQYGFWKVAVIRKHGSPASWRHLVPAAFVAGNLLSLAGLAGGLLLHRPMLAHAFLALFGLAAGPYLLASLAASVLAGRRDGWQYVPVLPVVFATYQFSYGIGFCLGLAGALRKDRQPAWLGGLITELTR